VCLGTYRHVGMTRTRPSKDWRTARNRESTGSGSESLGEDSAAAFEREEAPLRGRRGADSEAALSLEPSGVSEMKRLEKRLEIDSESKAECELEGHGSDL
jgi:hypothetical protein